MSAIRTILRDIAPEELGTTLCHEHLFTNPPAWAQADDADMVLSGVNAAVGECDDFAAVGGGALIEMTTPDYGRDVHGLLEVAKRSGPHVIAATGYQKGIYYPSSVETESIEDIAGRFINDVVAGMDGTEARAGVVKFGTCRTDHIRDDEQKIQRAVGLTHERTGVPIATHCQAGTLGDLQVGSFGELGVAPERILIGHLDRNLDYDYIRSIAQTGAWLGFDHWTKPKYPSDEIRAEFIRKLLDEGFSRIMISGDLGRPSYQPHHGGTPGFAGLLTSVKQRFPDDVWELLTVSNPRDFFSFNDKEANR